MIKKQSWNHYVILAYKETGKELLTLKEIYKTVREILEKEGSKKAGKGKTVENTIREGITEGVKGGRRQTLYYKVKEGNKVKYGLIEDIDLLLQKIEGYLYDENGNKTHKYCYICDKFVDINNFRKKQNSSTELRGYCNQCDNKARYERKKREEKKALIKINADWLLEEIDYEHLKKETGLTKANVNKLYKTKILDLDLMNKLIKYLNIGLHDYLIEIDDEEKRVYKLRDNKEYKLQIDKIYNNLHEEYGITMEEFANKLKIKEVELKELIEDGKKIKLKTIELLIKNFRLYLKDILN